MTWLPRPSTVIGAKLFSGSWLSCFTVDGKIVLASTNITKV